MKDYGDYPEMSVAWWEEKEVPVYGKEVDEFEWDTVEEDETDE